MKRVCVCVKSSEVFTCSLCAFALMVGVFRPRDRETCVQVSASPIVFGRRTDGLCLSRDQGISRSKTIHISHTGLEAVALMVHGSSCLGQNNIRPRFVFTHGLWAFASMVGLLSKPIGLENKTPSTFYLYALCLCLRFNSLREATKVG